MEFQTSRGGIDKRDLRCARHGDTELVWCHLIRRTERDHHQVLFASVCCVAGGSAGGPRLPQPRSCRQNTFNVMYASLHAIQTRKKYRRQVFKKERTRKNRKLDVKRIPTKLVASAISFAIIWFKFGPIFFFFFQHKFLVELRAFPLYTESRWRIPDWRQVLSIRTRFARLGGRLTTWSVLDFQSRQTLFFEEFCLVSMKRYWNGENHACAEETAIHHNWSATAAS